MSSGISRIVQAGVLALCAAGLLHACGGGGGGGGDSTTSDTGTSSGGTAVQPKNAWVHEAYIKAVNGDDRDGFGNVLAVSGDTLVVGASDASKQTTITNGPDASNDNSAAGAGAVYVYKRSGTTWVQQAYLKAPNAEAGDHFGAAVAIDGDTIVVGAPSEASSQTTVTNGAGASADNSAEQVGAAYVFVRNGDTWTHQAYLKAHNAGAGDEFGISVAISGNTVVVGAYKESSEQDYVSNGPTGGFDDQMDTSGAAYVFVRSGTTWSQQAYLKASNNRLNMYPPYFGASVAIDGNTIVVGAHGEPSAQTTITNGGSASEDRSAQNAGAAYVFVRNGVNWSQQAYLKASNADAADFFGDSVAISGDTIVVGATGEGSNQTTITNGSSASADTSLVGAGAAYVFKRSGNQWAQQAYLKASNTSEGNDFGNAVAISGDVIVVGAFFESSSQTTITNGSGASSDKSASGSGAAYIFKRSDGQWAQTAYLKAPNTLDETDNTPGDHFGWPVAINGNTVAVGASNEDSNQRGISNGSSASTDHSSPDSGAAYVFKYYP